MADIKDVPVVAWRSAFLDAEGFRSTPYQYHDGSHDGDGKRVYDQVLDPGGLFRMRTQPLVLAEDYSRTVYRAERAEARVDELEKELQRAESTISDLESDCKALRHEVSYVRDDLAAWRRVARVDAMLEDIASALDAAGGDTDPPGPIEHWREDYPDLWACHLANKARDEMAAIMDHLRSTGA